MGLGKKILLVASSYPSDAADFSGVFIRDQAQVLCRRYSVAVLAPRFSGLRSLIRGGEPAVTRTRDDDDVMVFEESAEFLSPFSKPLSRVNFNGPSQSLSNGPQSLGKTRRFDGQGRRFFPLRYGIYHLLARRCLLRVRSHWGSPDIIHAHVIWPAGWIGLKLGSVFQVPVILTEHTGPFHVHLHTRLMRRLVSRSLRGFKKVIAVSPAMAEQMHHFCPDLSIDIIGNVIRTEFFTPRVGKASEEISSPKKILSVAMLRENKGVQYLIKAVRLLAEHKSKDFKLLIGGDGPARPKLQTMVRNWGLSEKCQFLGQLQRSEMRHWMQRCDVFVLPSLSETFGVVLGEAMACGKPVIATRCGGPEFVVKPGTGVLVEKANAGALAQAIKKLLEGKGRFDPHLIRQNVVRRFGEKAFLDKMSRTYDGVLNGSGRILRF
jgi:glycosyltransferase involved in cell wall biosynthesis